MLGSAHAREKSEPGGLLVLHEYMGQSVTKYVIYDTISPVSISSAQELCINCLSLLGHPQGLPTCPKGQKKSSQTLPEEEIAPP